MNIKRFKKSILYLLSASLLCTLTACGQSSTQPSSSQGSQSSQASSQSEVQSSSSSQVSSSQSSQSSQASQSSGSESSSSSTAPNSADSGVLVVYFSATGNTKAVAEVISATTDGELYEIVPETPYTSADLNWTEESSRSNKEHEDPSIRPAIAGEAKDLSSYDTIFIGYPIWWGEAPNIVWNFVESSDLKGKSVIPFATSSSSEFGSSGKTLEGFSPDANWIDGHRFRSGVAEADVISWVNGLDLK